MTLSISVIVSKKATAQRLFSSALEKRRCAGCGSSAFVYLALIHSRRLIQAVYRLVTDPGFVQIVLVNPALDCMIPVMPA